jgi:hypothetical protein
LLKNLFVVSVLSPMTTLEKATHFALLALSAVAAYVLLDLKFSTPAKPGIPPALAQQLENFKPGTFQRALSPNDSAKKTVVHLVLSSTCPHCLRQAKLYDDLAKLSSSKPSFELRVYAKDGTERVAEAFPSLKAHLSSPEAATQIGLPIAVSPGLILVSNSGKILFSKFGALDDFEQSRLVNLLI